MLEHGSYSGDPVTKVLLQPLTGGWWGRGSAGGAEVGNGGEWNLRLLPWDVAAAWWVEKNKAQKGLSRAKSHTQLTEDSGFSD